MTLSEIQDDVTNRARRGEICDALHRARSADTVEDFIAAGSTEDWVFAYSAGIIDDAFIPEIDESKWNAAGIYTNGTFSLTNPSDPVVTMRTAEVSITLTGANTLLVYVMGNSVVTAIGSGNAYYTIRNYGSSTLSLVLNNSAMAILDSKANTTVGVDQRNNSILQLAGSDKTSVNLELHDLSFTRAKMFNFSKLEYVLNDSAAVEIDKHQNAVVTDNSIA